MVTPFLIVSCTEDTPNVSLTLFEVYFLGWISRASNLHVCRNRISAIAFSAAYSLAHLCDALRLLSLSAAPDLPEHYFFRLCNFTNTYVQTNLKFWLHKQAYDLRSCKVNWIEKHSAVDFHWPWTSSVCSIQDAFHEVHFDGFSAVLL